MELQQDTIDLTLNDDDDDDCLFPPELGQMAGSLLELDEMVGNKKTAKQNDVKQELSREDDTLSIYGSEDGEITTDGEEEKEEENGKKKVIFKRIWPNLGKKPRKATSKSAAFDVYLCTYKTIYPGHREKFRFEFKMKMPEGCCAKINGRLGMTANHGVHLAGGISIIDPDFREPISICLQNSHLCKPYEIEVNGWIGQMMIDKVEEFKWIEGTEDDFKIEGAPENASEGHHGRKRVRNLEGFGSTEI